MLLNESMSTAQYQSVILQRSFLSQRTLFPELQSHARLRQTTLPSDVRWKHLQRATANSIWEKRTLTSLTHGAAGSTAWRRGPSGTHRDPAKPSSRRQSATLKPCRDTGRRAGNRGSSSWWRCWREAHRSRFITTNLKHRHSGRLLQHRGKEYVALV